MNETINQLRKRQDELMLEYAQLLGRMTNLEAEIAKIQELINTLKKQGESK